MKIQAVIVFVSSLALSHGLLLDILNKITGNFLPCTDSSAFKDPLIGMLACAFISFL